MPRSAAADFARRNRKSGISNVVFIFPIFPYLWVFVYRLLLVKPHVITSAVRAPPLFVTFVSDFFFVAPEKLYNSVNPHSPMANGQWPTTKDQRLIYVWP